MRISSANTLKQTKEKSERPLTSTTTRLDGNVTSLSKRSSTPSGLASNSKGTFLSTKILPIHLPRI
jgi:hypothetical protein